MPLTHEKLRLLNKFTLKIKSIVFIFISLFIVAESNSATIYQTLHINRGFIKPTNVLTDSVEVVMYNSTNIFIGKNEIIEVNVGDVIEFTITNNDVLTHGFSINGITLPNTVSLSPSSSTTFQVTCNSFGLYQYFDSENFPHYKSLGASGMIYVHDDTNATFFWNLNEFDTLRSEHAFNGVFDPINDYKPTYFTINGLSNPKTTLDPTQAVVGNVNDEIIICILNSGLSFHSIHFHGYHLEVLYATESYLVSLSKDTFPFKPNDTMILKLIPDKEGIYPIHDHNLVAVTGNQVYANGMFQILTINP